MSQIFHPSTNAIAKASIFGAIFIIAAIVAVWAIFLRSPYMTQVGVVRDQPVPFSHEHHVDGLGIDCRYCHTSVEQSSFAGLPPTKTCMTCHSQVWQEAPALAPVRESFQNDQPLAWTRVHDLPDYVYFDHSIHVSRGIACESCHGRVDQMPLMWRVETLHMEWCLGCHRNPEEFVRPRSEVFTMGWQPADDLTNIGERLVDEYHIAVDQLDDCSICHR